MHYYICSVDEIKPLSITRPVRIMKIQAYGPLSPLDHSDLSQIDYSSIYVTSTMPKGWYFPEGEKQAVASGDNSLFVDFIQISLQEEVAFFLF